jgi:hypothetical protein
MMTSWIGLFLKLHNELFAEYDAVNAATAAGLTAPPCQNMKLVQ